MGTPRSTFGFCVLGIFVFLLCPKLISAKNASTKFALHSFNDSTINCFGNKSLAFLEVNDNGASSVFLQYGYNSSGNRSTGNFFQSGFCSYKNHIQFSNDTSFSTMFSFEGSARPDSIVLRYDFSINKLEYSSRFEQAFGFFVAGKCDTGSATSASGCPGYSNFLDSSLAVLYFLPSNILQLSIYGSIYATASNTKFTDKTYVWIDSWIDDLQNSTTLSVRLSPKPVRPCKAEAVHQALRLPGAARFESPFNSGSVVGFYGYPNHRAASDRDSRWFYNFVDLQAHFNVRDWSFSTPGQAVNIYKPGQDCYNFAAGGPIGLINSILVMVIGVQRKNWKEKNHLLAQLKLLNFGAREFTYKELQQATDNFADEIGMGGFGLVFKGNLQGVGTVAVKKIIKTERNVEDAKQLVVEVEVIDSVRHVNIVPLHGWCQKGVMLLVYKFIDNDNLSMHLFPQNPSVAPPLAWTKRMKALRGVASALVFLHEEFESEERVIHRDIKPTNVMLDSEFNARLGDFGLARLSKRTEPGHQSRSIAGIFGYIAPEYSSGATTQTDVYSFRVLVVVVATARKPLDSSLNTSGQGGLGNLVGWVRHLYDQGRVLEAGDESLRNGSDWSVQDSEEMERVLKVGLCCCLYNADQRPTMRQALTALQGPSTMFSAPLALHSPAPIEYPSFESWSRANESSTVNSESVSLLSNSGPFVPPSQSLNISENVTGSRPQNRVVQFQERMENNRVMDTIKLE